MKFSGIIPTLIAAGVFLGCSTTFRATSCLVTTEDCIGFVEQIYASCTAQKWTELSRKRLHKFGESIEPSLLQRLNLWIDSKEKPGSGIAFLYDPLTLWYYRPEKWRLAGTKNANGQVIVIARETLESDAGIDGYTAEVHYVFIYDNNRLLLNNITSNRAYWHGLEKIDLRKRIESNLEKIDRASMQGHLKKIKRFRPKKKDAE